MAIAINKDFPNKKRIYLPHNTTPEERTTHAAELKLTTIIDDILLYQWDPIGISAILDDFGCEDEYHFYLPYIVDMVMDGSPLSDVSDQLLVYEGFIKGDDMTNRRRCDVIAAMVSHYGPHADQSFKPNINTDTPEAAYQSVLDLVTQTRIAAYEKKWESVCEVYEQVVALCQTFFAQNHALYGSCLNNLGIAYVKTNRLSQAAQTYALALSEFEYAREEEEYDYVVCLSNLLSVLDHTQQHKAATPLHFKLLLIHTKNEGSRSTEVREQRQKYLASKRGSRKPKPLQTQRIAVAKDARGRIQGYVVID